MDAARLRKFLVDMVNGLPDEKLMECGKYLMEMSEGKEGADPGAVVEEKAEAEVEMGSGMMESHPDKKDDEMMGDYAKGGDKKGDKLPEEMAGEYKALKEELTATQGVMREHRAELEFERLELPIGVKDKFMQAALSSGLDFARELFSKLDLPKPPKEAITGLDPEQRMNFEREKYRDTQAEALRKLGWSEAAIRHQMTKQASRTTK